MPYCPKCDMEFVDGITVCSDCGGLLAESKEAAQAAKIKAVQEAQAAEAEKMAALQKQWAEEAKSASSDSDAPAAARRAAAPERTRVYVKKSQQYDDFKSSASAFYGVGGVMLIGAVLGWTGILPLPFYGMQRLLALGVFTAIGAACLAVAVSSSRSAKQVQGQVKEEEKATEELIGWFTLNYTGAQLDAQIKAESGILGPEELSLKRFSLIQDILITNHDIADQSYIDMISEEVYSRLYND